VGVSTPAQFHRAYAVLDAKAVKDGELRIIRGIASTPEVDRVGDIVEPKGATFASAIPLLLHHDSRLPVGTVKLNRSTEAGITFEAQLPEVTNPGTLRDRIEEAWDSVKAGLIRGVSIGFRALEDGVEVMKSGGLRFKAIEIMELSLVAIPANASASISAIKVYDTSPADAGGTVRSSTATAVAISRGAVSASPPKSTAMKTVQEQKAAFAQTREDKAGQMKALMDAAAEKNVTLDGDEAEKYDALDAEIKSIDAHLKRLDALEVANIGKAVPVTGATGTEAASAVRGGQTNVVQVNEVLPKGMGFARGVKATLVAKLDGRNPLDVAKQMYPSDQRLHKHLSHVQMLPQIIMQLKAAVPAATTTDSTWAGALVDPTNLPGEFIEFLRPETIIGRLNLRGIPTNVRLIEQTQGGTGYWVGQGAPKPLTSFGYSPITLSPTKVAAIAVATKESLRYSTPSLDMLMRDGLRDAIVERVDIDLLDPAEAGSANVQPASLTNGLVALTSAGTSADNVRTDLANLVQALRSAHLRGSIAIVLPDALLTAMAFMVNSLGQPEFPGLDNDGGTYKGIRFIGSEYVANASGSGNMVVAIAEREVFVSNDGGVTIDASDQASLQMLNNPTNNSGTATPTTMVSMFQTNSVAFLGEWHINWQKRRSSAVVYMDDVNWGSVGSPA
jgi:HK97 family phage major capsid protein/HK97 family phage prohead protease